MRFKRTVLIPAILALAAGSVLAGTAGPASAAPAHATHVTVAPDVFYHG